MGVISYIVLYLAIINLTGFLMMGIDKRKARKGPGGFPKPRCL